LLYGVPLEVYASKFTHMHFEPSGMTNDPDIRAAKSMVDYIFRWMGEKWVRRDPLLGLFTPGRQLVSDSRTIYSGHVKQPEKIPTHCMMFLPAGVRRVSEHDHAVATRSRFQRLFGRITKRAS
jgi:hypothetical protein